MSECVSQKTFLEELNHCNFYVEITSFEKIKLSAILIAIVVT